MSKLVNQVMRSYVDFPWGQMHIRQAGERGARPPVVLVHQGRRSGDEFVEVLEHLSGTRWAVAPDLPGMGYSDSLQDVPTIEAYAAEVVAAMSALGIKSAHVMGHHTGAIVAMEIAAGHPDFAVSLTLSSCSWLDATLRSERAQVSANSDPDEDGGHLHRLWTERQAIHPAQRPDLLNRYVRDALLCDATAISHMSSRYRMEERAPLVRCPVMQLVHPDDAYAATHADTITKELSPARRIEIPGGHVPVEYRARDVADALGSFADAVDG